jgi:hypothetical protein
MGVRTIDNSPAVQLLHECHGVWERESIRDRPSRVQGVEAQVVSSIHFDEVADLTDNYWSNLIKYATRCAYHFYNSNSFHELMQHMHITATKR